MPPAGAAERRAAAREYLALPQRATWVCRASGPRAHLVWTVAASTGLAPRHRRRPRAHPFFSIFFFLVLALSGVHDAAPSLSRARTLFGCIAPATHPKPSSARCGLWAVRILGDAAPSLSPPLSASRLPSAWARPSTRGPARACSIPRSFTYSAIIHGSPMSQCQLSHDGAVITPRRQARRRGGELGGAHRHRAPHKDPVGPAGVDAAATRGCRERVAERPVSVRGAPGICPRFSGRGIGLTEGCRAGIERVCGKACPTRGQVVHRPGHRRQTTCPPAASILCQP